MIARLLILLGAFSLTACSKPFDKDVVYLTSIGLYKDAAPYPKWGDFEKANLRFNACFVGFNPVKPYCVSNVEHHKVLAIPTPYRFIGLLSLEIIDGEKTLRFAYDPEKMPFVRLSEYSESAFLGSILIGYAGENELRDVVVNCGDPSEHKKRAVDGGLISKDAQVQVACFEAFDGKIYNLDKGYVIFPPMPRWNPPAN